MGAPKPRPLATVTRVTTDKVRVTTTDGTEFAITREHLHNGYPSGGPTTLYPTELAQVSTRLARHFDLDWQVKYTDSNGEPQWRPVAERIQFIWSSVHNHLPISRSVNISRSENQQQHNQQVTSSTSHTTQKETTEMGSIEQIIQDLIDLRLAGHRPAMDEDAIRNLVAEAVAGIKPPRIEIKVNEQVKVLDKHTHPMFGQVLSALTVARQSTKWPYLVGPSGTGKSTMAEHLAEALDVPFHTVSMSADKMMHDLIGFVSPVNHSYKEQPLVTLMRNGGVGLIDEIDKAHSSILPGMNGALAQGYITLPTGERMKISDRFYFVAGANTYGTGPDAQYVGSSQIDAATLNRFVRIPIDYDRTYEQARACAVLGERNGTLWCVAIEKMRANRDKHRIDTIISTRDVVGVPHLVATGTITPEQAVEWTIVGNLKEDHRNRLMEGVDLSCLSSVKK